jgi:hypothetical protein
MRVILLWEDSVTSFWITAMFLGTRLVSLILTCWAVILTWTGRIVVYGLFDPQMKIVGLWLRGKSDELLKVMETFDRKKKIVRLRREQALKVKAQPFKRRVLQLQRMMKVRKKSRSLIAGTACPRLRPVFSDDDNNREEGK